MATCYDDVCTTFHADIPDGKWFLQETLLRCAGLGAHVQVSGHLPAPSQQRATFPIFLPFHWCVSSIYRSVYPQSFVRARIINLPWASILLVRPCHVPGYLSSTDPSVP